MRLDGRSAIITGGSVGLGYAIACRFLAEGANVAICSRNASELRQACQQLTSQAGPGQRVVAVECNVSSADQVDRLVSAALHAFDTVEILVNNAGVLGPIGKFDEVDLDHWRAAVETNLFGVMLTTRALLPHLRVRGYGKILNVSGGGAASPRPFFSAYAASKAAVVRLTENLAEELRGTGIDVNAIAPGALNTRMLSSALAAGRERVGEAEFGQIVRQQETGGASIDRAAELFAYLSSAVSDGITGRLISAPWDPWSTLHQRVEELNGTDIYTLRRIVPEDRAKGWN